MTEKKKILKETLDVCQMHADRMQFAAQKLNAHFPLSIENYSGWSPETVALCDQMIYRFSKLQNTMGNKLFPLILQNLEEDIEGLSFKDILLKLEKLNILHDSGVWLELRETRNTVTHEYPENLEEIVDGLNTLFGHFTVLLDIWQYCKKYADKLVNA